MSEIIQSSGDICQNKLVFSPRQNKILILHTLFKSEVSFISIVVHHQGVTRLSYYVPIIVVHFLSPKGRGDNGIVFYTILEMSLLCSTLPSPFSLLSYIHGMYVVSAKWMMWARIVFTFFVCLLLGFFFYFFKTFYLFIFRERGREGEREGKKHQCVVASHMAPTGDLPCNPGMYPDWKSNWQPFGSKPALNPLSYTSQGCFYFLVWRIWNLQKYIELYSKPLFTHHTTSIII